MAPVSSPDDRQRLRRSFIRPKPKPTFFPSERRGALRLFGRSNSAILPITAPPPSSDPTTRRSFLAKPPAPGAAHRVLTALRDQKRTTPQPSQNPSSLRPALTKSTGYDDPHVIHDRPILNLEHPNRRASRSPAGSSRSSVTSSLVGSADAPPEETAILEVDASEVSDDTSNVDRAMRSRRPSSEHSPPLQASHLANIRDDLLFIDDVDTHSVTNSIALTLVGDEEDDVPEAPASKMETERFAVYEERIRALQDELYTVKTEKSQMDVAYEQKNREQKVLLDALRARAADSTAEVEELTRQLRDTRKRLNRRIRELEEETEVQQIRHSEQLEHHRAVETHLRAEVDGFKSQGMGQRFTRTESTPTLLARRKRASTRSPYDPASSSRGSSGTDSSGSQVAPNVNFARVRSAGNVHEPARRMSNRSDMYPHAPRASTPLRRSPAASLNAGAPSARAATRRSLLRQSFVAHIHSSRYQTMRAAWYDFLGGENGHVTPEQFSRALRTLAIAPDARDRDLELLRQEVCGAEENDTGVVTWAMFVRFYRFTKRETA